MRFIDKRDCTNAFEPGRNYEIESLDELTSTACQIAENEGLGVLLTRQGAYRIIKKSGLGAYSDILSSLAEVDDFLKHLSSHKSTKY